jgi:hypothetical protein
MRARTGLWEPWVGNDPGPPGPKPVNGSPGRVHSAEACNRYAILQTSHIRLPVVVTFPNNPAYRSRNRPALNRLSAATRTRSVIREKSQIPLRETHTFMNKLNVNNLIITKRRLYSRQFFYWLNK